MIKTFKNAQNITNKFWNTKPVMKKNTNIFETKIIDTNIEKKTERTKLPDGFVWEEISYDNGSSVCDFINKYYKRGNNSNYVVMYDTERIKWETNNKGYFLVIKNNNEIIACVCVSFVSVMLNDKTYDMCNPQYLCCADDYKNHGITRVLVDEVARLTNNNTGIFLSNTIIAQPISTIRYYTRPLNYKKLRENDFVEIGGMKDDEIHNKLRINLKPNKQYIKIEYNESMLELVYSMYCKYMTSFNISMVLTKDELKNYLFNTKYVKTFLITSNNIPVDFVSYNFYDITNTQKTENNIIKACNLLMYSSNVIAPEIMFMNIMKNMNADGHEIVFINDTMNNTDIILSSVKNANEDTEDEEENANYNLNIMKTSKKSFMYLYNLKNPLFKQNMVSWFLF
uniref:glycylpeptide N-tetradecanoyltransferase n=1 Tax=viral metagenome TaxID=1070528 RepID=A0A6C0E2Z0_9ZZZZ